MTIIDAISQRQVLILGVEFEQEAMTIHFQEKRHIGENGIKSNSISFGIHNQEFEDLYLELQDDLADLVDKAERDIRENPIEEG